MSGRVRRLAGAAAVCAALAFLGLMVVTGAAPQQRQLVHFEPAGLMDEPAAAVIGVRIARADARCELTRAGDGWRSAGVMLPPEQAARLELALKYLHTARPVRELPLDAELREKLPAFGLDRPRLAIEVRLAGGRLLQLEFGAPGASDVLQYAHLAGAPSIHLLSAFVGEAWQTVADEQL